eukprot:jgi/Galph1/4884/GphlegSOOS_G3523.1
MRRNSRQYNRKIKKDVKHEKSITDVICQKEDRPPNLMEGWMVEEDADYSVARIFAVGTCDSGYAVLTHPVADPFRFLAVFIGEFEAQAIIEGFSAAASTSATAPDTNSTTTETASVSLTGRPLTHDIIKETLVAVDSSISRVAITHLTQRAFCARVWIHTAGGHELSVDARPSDAIALALRFRAPLYLNERLLDATGITLENVKREVREGVLRNFCPRKTNFSAWKGTESFNAASLKGLEPAPEALKLRSLEELAARISSRDLLNTVKEKSKQVDPVEHFRAEFAKAITEERYEDACKIRDKIYHWLLDAQNK